MTDVCLIVEHSYPHRSGGVSEAVDDLIRTLPDTGFSVLHLHDPAEAPVGWAYARPANLVEVVTAPAGAAAADAVPDAAVLHALCAGEASDAAAGAARRRGVPFVLTEHGLAWHEAQIGIVGCKPFRMRPRPTPADLAGVREQVARAYSGAHAITTVCAHNARQQARWGAPPERLRVIPNGVARRDAAAPSSPGGPVTIGLVGRVVPVKDVATFLRACRLVADAGLDARFEVVGPLDHDPGYVADCRALVAEMGLDELVTFAGEVPRATWPDRLDVVVLTSVSEAQPLALLEAMAAGRPVVSTAVGGCPELIGGRRPAGILTPPRDARATADALLRLVADPGLRARLGAAGRRRARTDHSPERLARAYGDLYSEMAGRRVAR